MVIEFTTNSGCWWSVLFLICSCNINVIIFTYVVIIITIILINIVIITTTTCIGLSCTLYSFSSLLPCLPPALLTGLKMQSSDLHIGVKTTLSMHCVLYCIFLFITTVHQMSRYFSPLSQVILTFHCILKYKILHFIEKYCIMLHCSALHRLSKNV